MDGSLACRPNCSAPGAACRLAAASSTIAGRSGCRASRSGWRPLAGPATRSGPAVRGWPARWPIAGRRFHVEPRSRGIDRPQGTFHVERQLGRTPAKSASGGGRRLGETLVPRSVPRGTARRPRPPSSTRPEADEPVAYLDYVGRGCCLLTEPPAGSGATRRNRQQSLRGAYPSEQGEGRVACGGFLCHGEVSM